MTTMTLANELRRVCGHDSRSVEGCLHCEAADALEQAHLIQPAQDYAALLVRVKIAARALVREHKVYAEDVETLADVAKALEALAAQPAQAVDVGVRPICQNSAESAEVLTYSSKPAIEVAAAWRLRIGSSDVWSFCTEEWQADFYGKQSGLPYEKQPLYTRALSGEKAGPVGDVPPIKPVFPDDADIDRWRAIGWNECRNSMLDARGSASKAKFFLVQGVNSEDTPVLLFSSNWFAEQYCKQNPQPDGYYQIYAALPASPTPDKEG